MIYLAEAKDELAKLLGRMDKIKGSIDVVGKKERIAALVEQMNAAGFWDDQKAAQVVISEMNQLKDLVGRLEALYEDLGELDVLADLITEELTDETVTAVNKEIVDEYISNLNEFKKSIDKFELSLLLCGPYDGNNAILEIHPGAGGTESQDWAEMLLRMYTRWADDKGYKVEMLDYHAGDEAGVKSVTLLVKGVNAYGYLQAEKGVHRLVRISPFDASGRRHTSFASVEVVPEFTDEIEVDIKPDDLKIDTYRSGGAGGQHVNTTDSAVRITHLPTGIVVTCQAERSQLKNRERAMTMLKGRIYEKQLAEQEAAAAEMRGEQKEIGWGSQIRSYVFHPYSMVKDHRTNIEVGNVNAVMDGEIDSFIDAYLRSRVG